MPYSNVAKFFVVTLIIANPALLLGQYKVPIPALSGKDQEALLLSADAPHWGNGIDCSSCHVVHQSPDAQLTKLKGNANLCMSCHNPAGVASNKPFTNADRAEPGVSGTSHAWEVPASNSTYGAEPPTEPEMSLRIYSGNIVCSTCHNQHEQTFPPFLRASNYQNALCKNCHSVRNVGRYRDSQANKGSHPVGLAYPSSDPRFYNSPQNPNLPLVDPDRVECTTCHSPHYADSGGANSGAGDGYLLKVANDNALCKACHTYEDHKGQSCRKCHQPHDPSRTNIFLVKESVATPNSGNRSVVLLAESGANSFADGDNNYNGICEVCHTQTAYHRNNSSGNHHHMAGTNCTTCHPHKDSFLPPSCMDCHNLPQDNNDGIPPGGRRAIVAEFGQTSHHLYSASLDKADCRVCHDMSQHTQGRVRLIDRDNPGIVYELTNRPMNDPAEAVKLVPFCLNCHDGDGDKPFSDGRTAPFIDPNLWNAAAHKLGGNTGMPLSCMGDGANFGCHANGHGSDNIKLLNANANVSLDEFCFNCHTSGRVTNYAISGAGLADDIEEAFNKNRKHNLGTSFTVGGKSFTLQCTTCHNPHIVTGKHWDVANGVSPITRPDLTADPATNPRAMGTGLWGAVSGQKMDDFAAKGSGTGDWKFNVYRGYPYGATNMSSNQPAVYQPPKKGSGYNFEFDGDKLPDYVTFCLDCHSYKMSSSVYPINWGQGISWNYSGNPTTWVTARAPHGLYQANRPYYSTDPGKEGNNGNPDPIFNQPGVTRGRGFGHWMRWPYESADRNAGINFVMSCTDCHEAHGSTIGSMLRTNPNNGTGSTIWNTMCNNCHYYYGGQHHMMSCGYASCHEQNSIHRIKKNGEYSGGKYLWIPPGIPNIVSAKGAIGSDKLMVTFSEGVYADKNQSGNLDPGDFTLIDNDNGRTILSVTHTPGDSIAELTLSSSLDASNDIDVDMLAAASVSIFDDLGIPMETNPVTISGPDCPQGITSFQLNEPAGSTTATDEQGILDGVVNDPGETFLGDGYFHGDGINNYIDFENDDICLQSAKALTIEMRIKPSGLEGTANYIKRILARDQGGNYQTSVWRNNNWATYNAPSGVASIAFWVNPTNAHGGKAWKPVLTDYNNYPIVSDHWYKIKIVWNSSKAGGIPGDIFVDDQGTDGNGAGENWSGYKNATDADQSQLPDNRKLQQGDEIKIKDGDFAIGCNVNNHSNNVFNGQIDWITWQAVADYSGVDDPPIPLQ